MISSSFAPRIIGPLASGLFAQINRIDTSDIGGDLGTFDGDVFSATDTGKSWPPLPGFDPATSETWPTDAQLINHLDAPAAPLVPAEVTPLQMRRALNTSGLRTVVESAVAAAPQDARDAWEFASVIRRDDPILAGMAAALGKTDAEIDALFILAATF
jgi:hypothetical protein